MKTGLSFETLSSNSKMVRLQYMLLVSPLTVSHTFYLLVAILEKVSIIYHIIYHMVILMKNLILGQQNKEITLLLQTIANKHFALFLYLSREQSRKVSTNRKNQVSHSVKLIMKNNPRLLDLTCLLKIHMTLLYTDPTLKTIFPEGCINSVFNRNQSLKQSFAPSLYHNKKVIRTNLMTVATNVTFAKIMFQLFYMRCHQYKILYKRCPSL